MKLFLIIATFTSAVLAGTQVLDDVRGPSESLAAFLENLKKQMPCGFPEEGIPPLAPFKAEYLEFNYEHELVNLIANVANLHVDGLDNYDVNHISFSVLGFKVAFDVNFNEIHASQGKYFIEAAVANLAEIFGDGELDFKLEDLRLEGKLQIGLGLKGAYLKSFAINVGLGGVKSNISGLLGGGSAGVFVNKFIETFLLTFVKEQSGLISQQVHDIVVPIADEVLSGFSLKDLLDMITNPKEPVPCIPEEYRKLFLH